MDRLDDLTAFVLSHNIIVNSVHAPRVASQTRLSCPGPFRPCSLQSALAPTLSYSS
jgi:hypothetical protein